MRRVVLLLATIFSAWLAVLVAGALPPRGQPLPNSDRMEQIIHLALFPDKPRDMSFMDYFSNFTDLNENLTKVLQRLEFGVLDSENLELAVRLAEDVKRLKELAAMPAPIARRAATTFAPEEIFNYRNFSWTWTVERRQKLFQFMEHSVYSSRYEINKLHNIRRRYNQSTVFLMGMMYGNTLEMKTTAGALYTTMDRMPPNITMLWYVFHYQKLLNLAYDVSSNVEFIYMLNDRLKGGFQHLAGMRGRVDTYSLPADSDEITSPNPFDMYRRKNEFSRTTVRN